jgi:hypothetical protein
MIFSQGLHHRRRQQLLLQIRSTKKATDFMVSLSFAFGTQPARGSFHRSVRGS